MVSGLESVDVLWTDSNAKRMWWRRGSKVSVGMELKSSRDEMQSLVLVLVANREAPRRTGSRNSDWLLTDDILEPVYTCTGSRSLVYYNHLPVLCPPSHACLSVLV